MLPLITFLLPFLLPSTFWITGTIAKNVTIDDTDTTKITYLPPGADVWLHVPAEYAQDRYNDSTTYCRTQGCTASFNFTGATAIYFGGYGEIDTNTGTFEVTLDGTTQNVAGNVSPDSPRAQQVLFWKGGLDPKKDYTITLRKTSPSNTNDLNVDFFTLTLPDPVTSTTGASTKSGTTTPGNTAPPNVALNTGQPSIGVTAGGIAAGIVAGLGIALLIWFIIRRRNRRKGGVTVLDGERLDLDGERDVAPVSEAGVTPFWPRYSDYAHPGAGGPEAGGEIYDPSHAPPSSYGLSNMGSDSAIRSGAGTEVDVPLLPPPPSYEAAGGETSAAALPPNPNRKQ